MLAKRIFFLLLIFFHFNPLLISGQTKSHLHYASFSDFRERIANKHALQFTDVPFRDSAYSDRKISADTVEKTFSFSLDKWRLKYITPRDTNSVFPEYYDPAYILFDTTRIVSDSTKEFAGLSLNYAAKATLGNSTFLLLPSSYLNCNGSFCRIRFDQLFILKNNKVSYQLITGFESPGNIYCDLNNDQQLDLITFAGDCFTRVDSIIPDSSEKYVFCIEALTLKDNKWVTMTDKQKKPYYIHIVVDDFFDPETFKILDYNWITEL